MDDSSPRRYVKYELIILCPAEFIYLLDAEFKEAFIALHNAEDDVLLNIKEFGLLLVVKDSFLLQ